MTGADSISLTVRLFGAFRRYGTTAQVTVPAGSTALAIKQKLAEVLGAGAADLVRDSALANDNTVIDDAAVVTPGAALAILPPVCGG